MRFDVFVMILLVSCRSFQIPQTQTSTNSYLKDLNFSVLTDGPVPITKFVGVGVMPGDHVKYTFIMEPRQKIELFRISNCHRDLPIRDPGRAAGGWLKGNKYMYPFLPNTRIETGSCIFSILLLDDQGRHQMGAVVFKQKHETLKSTMYCNGKQDGTIGTSFCQAQAGSLQAIDLYEDVFAKGEDHCPKLEQVGKRQFNVKMGTDYCTYVFMNKSKKTHRLITFGYDGLLKKK